MVVIFKACIEHGVSLALSHAIEFAFVVVAKAEVFHFSFSPPSGWEPAGSFALARSSHGQDRAYSEARWTAYSGAAFGSGKNRSSRTSPAKRQATVPLRAHART